MSDKHHMSLHALHAERLAKRKVKLRSLCFYAVGI